MSSPGRGLNIERSSVKVAATPNGDLSSIPGHCLIWLPSEEADQEIKPILKGSAPLNIGQEQLTGAQKFGKAQSWDWSSPVCGKLDFDHYRLRETP
jgi:hypothetical protein